MDDGSCVRLELDSPKPQIEDENEKTTQMDIINTYESIRLLLWPP